jgi:two-component system chemotaxis sensor kinase CheA
MKVGAGSILIRYATRGRSLVNELDDIIEEFLIESAENIDRLDIELVELEERPDSADLLASIFRNLHTIKGTAGFFGFSNLQAVAHAGENLLSVLRSGDLALSTEIADALLSTVDAIRTMLATVSETSQDGNETFTPLIDVLQRLADPDAEPAPAAEAVPAEPVAEEPDPLDPDAVEEDLVDKLDAVDDPEARPTSGGGRNAGAAGEHSADGDEQVAANRPEPAARPTPPTATPSAGNDSADASNPAASEPTGSNPVDATIRVDVSLLDRLMNLVGELVLARNQVLQYQAVAGEPTFQTTSQQLDLITTELQEGVMKTRMQPIGNLWAKLPRVVRDLAASCDKKVRLEMEGEDTELDKTILEAIKDPLTHIVRNSVDHGLESPADRMAVGKPVIGKLKLRALHEGGQVIIEIIDDGAGLDYQRIKEKAISQGLITPERAATMTDRDTAHLIFRPGFSTAKQVTNVSGRGVGMDVVRTNVEKIGGSLEIQSEPGKGTTLTIKIPLTLAIIPALIVSCDNDRYLISQINLVEVLHIDGSSGETKIEMAGDAPVLRLRGNLLPVVNLRDVLGLPPPEGDPEGVNIAVLHADGAQFGLVVDQINDTEEIVVKPLSPHLKSIGAFAGTTIMGDGAVSLILDATGIARLGGVLRDKHGNQVEGVTDSGDRRSTTAMVLVCTVGSYRVGIPLALVSRLEELPIDQIERASGKNVIQYRGRLLHLIYLDKVLDAKTGGRRETDREMLQVLVYETESGIHGLVVDEIIDVFETDLTEGEPASRPGIRTSSIIGRRVTDLLDITEIVGEPSRHAALDPTDLLGAHPDQLLPTPNLSESGVA